MSESKHNVLKLVWKNPRTRRNYVIGRLTRDKKYAFEYCDEYKEAIESGWELMEAFPEEKKYESESLFVAFACRLPDKKRRDIKDILDKYGLSSFDGFDLLRLTTGKLPIDTYEFIDPIFPEDETVEKEFYLMGIRYYNECKGVKCENLTHIELGDELVLVEEPNNKADRYAIKVVDKDDLLIGYIPRYYSQEITERLKKEMTYLLQVIEVNADHNCDNCIKVRLRIPREGN